MALLILTLQFIRPLNREALVASLQQGLRNNGCLILIEKVLGEHSTFNRLFINHYYEMKRRNGYKDIEITQKREALENVLIPYRLEENKRLLKHVGFSHVEADECGALNDFLAAAPAAVPVCSQVAAMVSVNDLADRPARALADGEVLKIGKHALRWLDAPHVPHGWECGFMMETETRTLLCGDLFTQGGSGATPITESDILGPSEAFRAQMD